MKTHAPSTDASLPGERPSAPRTFRRSAALLISAGALLVQLLVPASYYVGEAAADERFAWRMFSSRRAESCRVQASEIRPRAEGTKRVALKLSGLLHRAWIHGLSRRRPAIMERFFQWRCEDPLVEEVRLVRRCKSATGKPQPEDLIVHACRQGERP